jgi:hypothetical protein
MIEAISVECIAYQHCKRPLALAALEKAARGKNSDICDGYTHGKRSRINWAWAAAIIEWL